MTEEPDISDAINDAITTWLADNRGGGIVTAFTLCAEYIDADGDRSWATAHHEQQTPSHTLGLLRWHTINVEQQCAGYMYTDDEDDE